jgi:hypothetical protein
MLNHSTNKVAPKAVTVAPARTISLSLRTMTIQRAGLSNFLVVAGSNHCGPADQLIKLSNGARAIPVRWNVAVECEPQVDARGFLFDQAMLGVFVDRIASEPTTLSCELLARHVAERLIARLEKLPHCKIRSLKLEFSPNPYAASITVVYS